MLACDLTVARLSSAAWNARWAHSEQRGVVWTHHSWCVSRHPVFASREGHGAFTCSEQRTLAPIGAKSLPKTLATFGPSSEQKTLGRVDAPPATQSRAQSCSLLGREVARMHKTNGCVTSYYVHGVGQIPCSNHARMTRDLVESYQKPGAATRTVKPMSDKTGPRGVWMRNAGWRKVASKPKTAHRAALDACASRKVVYDMATVAIRKAVKL